MWFEEIPENLYSHIDLKAEKLGLEEIMSKDIEYLVLWSHRKSKLGNFSDIPESLRYLELNWSNI